MDSLLCLWILCAGVAVCNADNFLQERAEVTYANPKYVKEALAFTGRQRRGEPYRTNMTATTLVPFGNNVTGELYYKSKSSPTPLTLSVKMCDVIKLKWLADYMRTYSDFILDCPFLPGTYSITNMEFPPKNFPLPILKGDLRVKVTYYVTDTKEMIMQFTLIIHSK